MLKNSNIQEKIKSTYKQLVKEGYFNNQLDDSLNQKLYIPSDIYSHIFKNLNINDLISLYNTNKSYHDELNKKEIVNYLSNQYKLKKSNSFIQFIQNYKQKAFETLKILSKLYTSGAGFNTSEMHFKNDDPILLWALNNNLKIYDMEGNLITNNLEHGIYYVVLYLYEQKDKLNEISEMILPYDDIIIRRNKFITKYTKYVPWYNKDIPMGLPSLASKSYINIIYFMNEVGIYKNLKGTDLTINDVLFATRALTKNRYTSVGGGITNKSYDIFVDEQNHLILKIDLPE